MIRTLAILAVWGPSVAFAGGGPRNVMVLFNEDAAPARDVAEYYAAARDVRADQLCPIAGIDPDTRVIDFADYDTRIRTALEACLENLSAPEEIDYLVVVRGLPYRVDLGVGAFSTSLSAMLQVARAQDRQGNEIAGRPQAQSGAVFAASVLNPQFEWGFALEPGDYTVQNPSALWYNASSVLVRTTQLPRGFTRAAAGGTGTHDFFGELFIVSRLDGFDYQDARDLVDRAIDAEASGAAGTLMCMEGADEARSARDPECEFVTRMLAAAGFDALWRTPHDALLAGQNLGAFFTGARDLQDAIDGNVFAPGALVDNLTSFGGAPANFFCDATGTQCPETENQTAMARWVRAGASGVHGMVAEPLNNSFPNASALLLYTLGYSMGESFLMSQRYVYWQDIYLGDPLLAPYAERPVVTVSAGVPVPAGQPMTVIVTASHPRGIARLRLWVEGVLVEDAPADSIEYRVPLGPTSDSVSVQAIATAANAPATGLGWPEPAPLPRPDVQGWVTQRVDRLESPPPLPQGGGCACEATQTGFWPWPALALLLLWRWKR